MPGPMSPSLGPLCPYGKPESIEPFFDDVVERISRLVGLQPFRGPEVALRLGPLQLPEEHLDKDIHYRLRHQKT